MYLDTNAEEQGGASLGGLRMSSESGFLQSSEEISQVVCNVVDGL